MSQIRVREPFSFRVLLPAGRRRLAVEPLPGQPTSTVEAPKPVRPHPQTVGRAWVTLLSTCLRATDVVLILAALFAGYLLRWNSVPAFAPNSYNGRSAVIGAALAVLWIGALEIYHTRDPKVLGVGGEEYKRVASASVRVFGFIAVVAVVFRLDLQSMFFLVSLPAGVLALTSDRWIFRRWLSGEQAKGRYLSTAIVIGEPEDVRYVIKQLTKKSRAVYEILGTSLPGARRGAAMNIDGRRIPVLSSTDDVVRTVGLTGADTVIVAGPLPGGNQFIRELGWRLEEHSAEMVLASTLTNVAGPRIHWRPVEGLPLMHVDIPQYSGGKHVLKRAIDIITSAGALILISPVLLVLAIIIRLDSPGPVFFRQERVGRQGDRFEMIKFRSMVTSAEAELAALLAQNQGSGVLFKMENDPRVTKCGRWMRKYSLDELPQFLNVLTGQMSLVGPRPPLPREVNSYERHTYRRLLIKPGITGLWQINGRSDLPWDDAVRLDLYYVENWSIAGDIIIMWRTFRAMTDHHGAY